jgi:hypothetical protein
MTHLLANNQAAMIEIRDRTSGIHGDSWKEQWMYAVG